MRWLLVLALATLVPASARAEDPNVEVTAECAVAGETMRLSLDLEEKVFIDWNAPSPVLTPMIALTPDEIVLIYEPGTRLWLTRLTGQVHLETADGIEDGPCRRLKWIGFDGVS